MRCNTAVTPCVILLVIGLVVVSSTGIPHGPLRWGQGSIVPHIFFQMQHELTPSPLSTCGQVVKVHIHPLDDGCGEGMSNTFVRMSKLDRAQCAFAMLVIATKV